MLTMLLLSVLCVADDGVLAGHVQTLVRHIERLEAIEVPAEQDAEKQAKLADLRARLQQGAQDDAAFQSLYGAIDDVRINESASLKSNE